MAKCFRCGNECGDNLYCTDCANAVKDKIKESVKENTKKNNEKNGKKGWW